MHASQAPDASDAEAVRALRRALDQRGFTRAAVRRAALSASRGGSSPLETLVRLFVLHQRVSMADADRALQPLSVATATQMRVLAAAEKLVTAAVELVPLEPTIVAADWTAYDAPDAVMSPARSSRLLAALTQRPEVEAGLDLGTGCGYQALLLARHTRHVIATDSNPRALAYAKFNALLNAAQNIELRQGDWFEAVQAEWFDLVVCNPPYVIAPDQRLLYRDDPSGNLSRRLVQGMPAVLRPAGLAHVMIGWAHATEGHWFDPLRGWIVDTGWDAWFLREGSSDPATYAATWNAGLAEDRLRYADAIERWTRHFVAHGIERLADGIVVMRRRTGASGSAWFDNLPPGELGDDAWEDLGARLVAVDVLAQLDDAALLRQRMIVTGGQRLEQTLRHDGAAFAVEQSTLVGERGLRARLACNSLFVRVLAALDGRRSLGEAIADVLTLTAAAPAATHRFELAMLFSVRQAIARGFVQIETE